MSGDSAVRTPNNRDLDPTGEVGAAMVTTLDCPSAEGSEDMSVTNSEVESAMNHRRCRAVYETQSSRTRHLTPLARVMHTSELLEPGLEKPRGNI